MLLLILIALLGGTSTAPAASASRPSNDDGANHFVRPRQFLSPMGEPFLPIPEAPDGLQRWFQQADGDHDGALTVRELQRDADRFFQSLDVRHDGEIDPEDITRYENEIAPEVQVRAMSQSGGGWHGQGGSGHGRRGDHHRDGDNGGGSFGSRLEGGARYSLLNIPEPVASADADFNRGVSLTEFEHAARQRFVLLDSNQDGKLTLPELEMIAQATAAASRRHRHERPANGSETIDDHPGEVGQSGPGGEFPN